MERPTYIYIYIYTLNKIIHLRFLIDTYKNKIPFRQSCLDNNLAPGYILRRIKKIKCRNTINVLRAFLKDEISFFFDSIESVKARLYFNWKMCWSSLSFFDLLRFSKYLTNNSSRLKSKLLNSNQQFWNHLIKRKFGSIVTSDKHIFNYSSYVLSDCEKLVLSRELNFCVPPSRSTNSAAVFAEFELYLQLRRHCLVPSCNIAYLKARLAELDMSFVNTPVDSHRFLWQKMHFESVKQLKMNPDIILTKPDKGAGVVILNRADYIGKMNAILKDTDKFLKLGDLSFDDTQKLENKLQKRFLESFRRIFISKEVYEFIRLVGSQRPRMYGLPKIHKPGILLRPILSMCHSVQHSLARWLVECLNPVLDFYSVFCVKDSFTFSSSIRRLPVCNDSQFLVSFDIVSLFTNIPLDETVSICADFFVSWSINYYPSLSWRSFYCVDGNCHKVSVF